MNKPQIDLTGQIINNIKIINNDDRKRTYCQNNNIKLIEIPYWDYDKLNWNYIKEKLND